MSVAVKICGIRSIEALRAASEGKARYVGFVFHPASPRHLALDEARALAAQTPTGLDRVGVFASQDMAAISAAADAAQLTIAQLHGCTPAFAAHVARETGLRIWTAIAVRNDADLHATAQWIGAADRLLFDAATHDPTMPGGMGQRFDWTLLRGFSPPLPWGLAGGLHPLNVASAIAETGAPLVDVSSGVESSPGIKDVDKIAAFLKAVPT